MAWYYELPASGVRSYVKSERPSVRYYEGGFSASDTWIFNYADKTDALKVIGGTIEDVGGILTRVVPLRFKDYPFAIARSARGVDEGWDGSTPKYVRISIEYEAPKYSLDGSDAFLSVRRTPSARQYAIPASGATAGTGAFVTPIPWSIPGYNYNITLHRVSTNSDDIWSQYAGYVNSAEWRGFTAGTVLFHAPSSDVERSVNGEQSTRIDLHFEVSRVPWNQHPNESGTLTTVTFNSGQYRHPEVDFNGLFW